MTVVEASRVYTFSPKFFLPQKVTIPQFQHIITLKNWCPFLCCMLADHYTQFRWCISAEVLPTAGNGQSTNYVGSAVFIHVGLHSPSASSYY